MSNIRPPHNIEAEKAILGCALRSPQKIDTIVEMLPEPGDFYRPSHQEIYRAILRLHRDNEPVDLVTVPAELGEDRLAGIGGRSYLSQLEADVSVAENVKAHAKIVADKAKLRKLAVLGETVVESCHSSGADPDEIAEKLDQELLKHSSIASDEVYDIANAARDYASRLLGEVPDDSAEALETRIGYLNEKLGGGLRRGHMVVIGGSPSMGKTSLATDIILYNGNYGRRSLIFTIDELVDDVVRRAFSLNLGFDTKKMYERGPWNRDERMKIVQARDALTDQPWSIVDASGMTAMGIRSRARAYKRKHGKLDIVMVDYLGLIRPSSRTSQSRERDVAEISAVLKEMAKELDCCVLAISQLNRALNSEQLLHISNPQLRQVPRPRMSMLRDSGAIEADANVVLLPFLPSEYLRERLGEEHEWTRQERGTEEHVVPAEIIVGKNKLGPKCRVKCHFDQRRMRFFSLADQADPEVALQDTLTDEEVPF